MDREWKRLFNTASRWLRKRNYEQLLHIKGVLFCVWIQSWECCCTFGGTTHHTLYTEPSFPSHNQHSWYKVNCIKACTLTRIIESKSWPQKWCAIQFDMGKLTVHDEAVWNACILKSFKLRACILAIYKLYCVIYKLCELAKRAEHIYIYNVCIIVLFFATNYNL